MVKNYLLKKHLLHACESVVSNDHSSGCNSNNYDTNCESTVLMFHLFIQNVLSVSSTLWVGNEAQKYKQTNIKMLKG